METLSKGPVTAPGYYDFSEADYHADPAPKPSLSSSIATTLVVDTAADAKHQHTRLTPVDTLPPHEQLARQKKEEDKKFDMGNVCHFLLLGKGKELAPLPFDDYRTKAAQTARDQAFEDGMQPCLEKVFDAGQAMTGAALRQLAEDPDNHDAFGVDTGISEVSVFWQEQCAPGKMWMRCRPDRLMNDRRRIYDLKTFAPGPDPDGFVKYLVREGRDIQDPFYSRGVAAIEGCSWEDISFRFIVLNPTPPHTLSVVELIHEPGQENSDRGWSYERSQWAIDKWAQCAVRAKYPGWTPRTHYVGVPAFAKTAWEMRKAMDEAAERLLGSPQ